MRPARGDSSGWTHNRRGLARSTCRLVKSPRLQPVIPGASRSRVEESPGLPIGCRIRRVGKDNDMTSLCFRKVTTLQNREQGCDTPGDHHGKPGTGRGAKQVQRWGMGGQILE